MIICFSGTGNSRLVAAELSRRLEGAGIPPGEMYMLEGTRLRRPAEQLLEVADGEIVLWVFPIYSWGVPPVVERFIDKVRFKGAERARHFMVCTCGDDIGRADDRWRHHIGRRGWTPRGAFSVIMPNTYVCMKGFDVDPHDVEAGKLAAMPERVEKIVAAIRRGFAESDVTRGTMAWLKTNVAYWWFMANKMSAFPFRADPQTCTSCGKCARNCPMENITMQVQPAADGRSLPKWDVNCAMCLRCYHQCPTHAIAYGKFTLGKGQYNLSE